MNDIGVHARHSGVVAEAVSFPTAAPVAVSRVAIAVVDPSVKSDSRPPVALIKGVNAVVPAPPGRGPKQTHCRGSDPNAWDPVITTATPAPVPGSPNIACDRTGRL